MSAPLLQASKWLSCQMLIEVEEMQNLFGELGEFFIFSTGRVLKKGEAQMTKDTFLQEYSTYLESLKRGVIEVPRSFTSAWTYAKDHVVSFAVDKERELARSIMPVVQLQHHTIGYSSVEKKFRPMVLGKDCISWGLQFSFPQLTQDPSTKEVLSTKTDPNYPLFRALQKWMRNETVPTPFVVDGEQINVPMRLGKSCRDWINAHPQLMKQGIGVK